jgi:hypothetical protein
MAVTVSVHRPYTLDCKIDLQDLKKIAAFTTIGVRDIFLWGGLSHFARQKIRSRKIFFANLYPRVARDFLQISPSGGCSLPPLPPVRMPMFTTIDSAILLSQGIQQLQNTVHRV